jgi:putative SOS response-associated peptidase YedK
MYTVLMCGRYTIFTKKEALEERFDAEIDENIPYSPHYNAAPSQNLPVIFNDEPRLITTGQWGYLPSWALDNPKIKPQINARSETVYEKPMFRSAIKKKRCMILTDGFYEWNRVGEKKIPNYIRLKSHEPFAMAGIWAGDESKSFAVLTTGANKLISKIHIRMPVILNKEDEKYWLEAEWNDNEMNRILAEYESEQMEMYPISTLVNSPRNNTEQLIKPEPSE